MEQMSLSQVCKLYGFTRKVIQGYEKEGLIKSSGKNKYGHLMYDYEQVKKIAYIRYLQINGLSLKEIYENMNSMPYEMAFEALLEKSNLKHKEQIKRINELFKKNELITKAYRKEPKDTIYKIIMEEIKNEKNS